MGNIGEYIWALVIILTVASLFRSASPSKRKRQRTTDMQESETPGNENMDMQLDKKFEEVRKIIENIERFGQRRQTDMRHPKSAVRRNPTSSPTFDRQASAASNNSAQFATDGRFASSATAPYIHSQEAANEVPADTKQAVNKPASHSDAFQSASGKKCSENEEITADFNLRDAIIYSEIMKPKFED